MSEHGELNGREIDFDKVISNARDTLKTVDGRLNNVQKQIDVVRRATNGGDPPVDLSVFKAPSGG